MRRILIAIAVFSFAYTQSATADDANAVVNWPQFRGPGALNVVPDDPNLPETWSTTENVAWSTSIPGMAWASPIVWGNKVFLTSVINEGETEPPKKGLYFGGNRLEPPKTDHKWMVYAVDINNGKILWEKEAHKGVPEFPRHLKNSYGSETPATDGERVYAYFGNVGLFVYDLDGNPVWEKRWPVVKTRYGWGTAASPVVHKGRVYIVNDNDSESFVTALDAKTGKEIWTSKREEHSNWATPYIWENELRTELITPGTDKVRSYDLDGNLLWEFTGMSSITIAVPFSKFGLLYISSGYVGDKHRPVYAIKPGAKGDISLKEGEVCNDHIVWYAPDTAPYNPTPVIYGDQYYVLLDRGFFASYDAKTGKEVYGKQRIDPAAAAFTASPWAYNGKIFCLSEDGDTFVIKAGEDYEVIGKNSLEELCMSTPAIAQGKLLIRTGSKLYCIAKGGAKTAK
jgi:outer membrane protein assembly factor BamB